MAEDKGVRYSQSNVTLGSDNGDVLLSADTAGKKIVGMVGNVEVFRSSTNGFEPKRRIIETMAANDVDAQHNTLTALQVAAGIVLHTSVTAGGTVTFDTAVNIIAGSAGIGALTADNQCIKVYYINDGTQTLTFAAAAGVTIVDTGQTIAADEAAIILIRRVTSTAITAYIIGA